MISEVGTDVTVKVPSFTIDPYGNTTNITYTDYQEKMWVRPISDVIEVQEIGTLDKEDIRFEAKFNTHCIPESIIVYNSEKYLVLSIDKPSEKGNIALVVGYAKRMVEQ
jgi:hypothetical protein